MSHSFDVVVVGAGLAGCTAAIAVARAGRSVALIERGRRPGSKNVIGGILYTPVLDRLLPDFSASAPVERHIISRQFGFLNDSAHFTFQVGSDQFDQPPDFNRSYTVRRTVFDPWLVQQARAAGAVVVPATVVDGLLHEDQDPRRPVIGVRCRRENGEIRSLVTIIAEGANALLAEAEGLRPPTTAPQVMLGVKEILQLDRDVLEDRFGLEGTAGRAFEFFGSPARGGFGSGFLYTNRESISVGVACSLAHLARTGLRPLDLLEQFKSHPSVKPWIRKAEPIEYCAHLLPIGSTNDMPDLVRSGALLVGDAARLANMSHYKELTNLVTASGLAAGQAAVEAIDRGDVSRQGLQSYVSRLEAGFVLRDLRKYARVADLIEGSPELLERYPRLLVETFVRHLTVSERPKEIVEREMMRAWNREAKPAEVRRHIVDILEATGFSLAPVMRRMVVPSLVPEFRWLRELLSRCRLRKRKNEP